MDGAPYLRKVDLKMYKSYQELSKALEAMFSCFTIGTFTGAPSSSTHDCRHRDAASAAVVDDGGHGHHYQHHHGHGHGDDDSDMIMGMMLMW